MDRLSNSWPTMHERWMFWCFYTVWKFQIRKLPLPTCYTRSFYPTFKGLIYTYTYSFIWCKLDVFLPSFVQGCLADWCLFGTNSISGDFVHNVTWNYSFFSSYQLPSTRTQPHAMAGWPLSDTKKAQNAQDAYEDLKAQAIEAYKNECTKPNGKGACRHKISWICTGRRQGGQLSCAIIHRSAVLLVGGVGLRLMVQSPG